MPERFSQLLVWVLLLPPFVMALTLHEYAHAYVAYRLGDPTAKAMGRLTINPLKHVDWFGLILLFVIHFGWAKPVPVNPRYFRNPRRDMVWVAIAGPFMNFFMAICAAAAIRLLTVPNEHGILVGVLWYTMTVNIILGVFNLLPVPPLDGSRVLKGLLPENIAYWYGGLERYSLFLLAGLFIYIQFVQPDFVGFLVRPFTQLFSNLAGG